VIWPIWHGYQEQNEWRATAAHALARQRGLAAIEAAVRARLDALPKLQIWQRLYRANAQGAAVMTLQSDVNSALAASNARPQTFAPIAITETGPLRKVGLRIVASMTIDQLRAFLMQTERLAHFVRIEQLVVSAPPNQTPQTNPPLVVTMDIFGFAVDDEMANTGTLVQSRSP
jgi:hypothetical protein